MNRENNVKMGIGISVVIVLIVMVMYSVTGGMIRAGYGKASWYSEDDTIEIRNVHTASGEVFDDTKMTCAMRSREFGKIYIVTNLENGKKVACYMNDFGPNKKAAKRGIIIDLSKAAFAKIASLKRGIVRVRVEEFK